MSVENLVYGFRKRYSLPVLINLYHMEGLTFDQLYIISSSHSKINTSKQSISRAVTELLEKKYLKKDTVPVNGKAYTGYVLTDDAKKIMKRYLKKDV
jgi:DNA-binding MarR family transcriptional regulator